MKTFIILGMHRSATSLVAGGISNTVDMGSNSGHYENQEIKKINQSILKLFNGKWDNPPPELLHCLVRFQESGIIDRMKKALSKYEQPRWIEPLIGWKDPRTTLTIRLWLPYLENPHFICCYREPLEVAKSLQKRNGFTIEKGLKLAKIYNDRIKSFMDDWLKYE